MAAGNKLTGKLYFMTYIKKLKIYVNKYFVSSIHQKDIDALSC